MGETIKKGNLGVSKIIVNLLEQNLEIFQPFSNDSPIDLVVYADGKFYKVQIKFRTPNKNNKISVELRRMIVNRNILKYKTYNKNDVDILAIYCPNIDKCFYINLSKIQTKSISIDLDEYEKFKIFPVEG